MKRLAIGLEYDGTRFCGWQRQDQGESIQAAVEHAFSRVADETITLVAAGRTDAGVHATAQVAHFDTGANRDLRSWLLGANSNLPGDVSVSWVREVPDSFHARYSAVARTYHYVILNRSVRSALFRHRAWWLHGPLDIDAMRAATPALLGEHDFSAFRASQCQARSPRRRMQLLEVESAGPFITVTCRANAFLHHMVRNIVGSLVCIGRGEQNPEWLGSLLEGRDRRGAGMTAAAAGLYLTQVQYPSENQIPDPYPFRPGDL